MSYVRSISPIPLDEPCSTCGRLDESQYPGDWFDREEACFDHQMRWANGPWWCRWLKNFIQLAFRRKRGGLTGRPVRWMFRLDKYSNGFCPECTSHWYIWADENKLHVWASQIDDLPAYSVEEVKEIVEQEDYQRIPGFDLYGDQGVLKASLLAYLEDEAGEESR